MTILIPVVGILCTTLFHLLWYTKQIKTGRLAALYTINSARSLSSLDPKSLEYKLLASGLIIKPITFCLLRIAAGVCGMVIAWLFLPGLPAIMIGGIHFYIPGVCLDDRVKSRGRNIDQLRPIAIAALLQGCWQVVLCRMFFSKLESRWSWKKQIHSHLNLFSPLQKCALRTG